MMDDSNDKILGKRILIDGYRFVIGSQSLSTYYLKCADFRRSKCKARATKRKNSNKVRITYAFHNHGRLINEFKQK